jgi:hypothetical protein
VVKVKITGCGGHRWYKDFVGEVVEVLENETQVGTHIAYAVCMDKCSDDMKALFAILDGRGQIFPGLWWICKEDCEVVKEEKPLRVGDVVCFIGSKYEYDHPTITVVKIYMDCRSGYSVFDGVYFNKATGGYTTVVGVSVNAVERR